MKDYHNGDILVNITTKDNNNIIRKENDLYIIKKISLLDIYNNKNIEFIHLDGKKYNINLSNLPQCNYVYAVKDLGMPILNSKNYGYLYITINIEIPELNNNQIIKFNEILNNKFTEDELIKNN